jgi:curved DNA-binding protein CbpA
MAKKRKPDPYKTLGVDKDASADEIKAAFRKRAKAAHPDKGGSAEAFAAVKSAHLVLSDPARRAKYDETGEMDELGPEAHPDADALALIGGTLAQIIDTDGKDPLTINLIQVITDHFEKLIKECVDEIAKRKRAVLRAEKMAARFKLRKGHGDNIMARAINWKRRDDEHLLVKLLRRHKAIVRAREIVREYEFEQDPQRFVVFGCGGTTTASFTR